MAKHSESNEQIAAMDWLRVQHPKIVPYTMHIGNERKSSYYAGYIMKRMGVLPGASDLLIAYPVGPYHGAFIEIKSKVGKPSDLQLAFLNRMQRVGYYTALAYGADEVINAITEYLNSGQNGTSSSSKGLPAGAAV